MARLTPLQRMILDAKERAAAWRSWTQKRVPAYRRPLPAAGTQFGMLTFLGVKEPTRKQANRGLRPLWRCECACGATVLMQPRRVVLVRRTPANCGCEALRVRRERRQQQPLKDTERSSLSADMEPDSRVPANSTKPKSSSVKAQPSQGRGSREMRLNRGNARLNGGIRK